MTRPLWFFGTPAFAEKILRALVEADYFISLVVTQPDRPKGRGHEVALSEVKKFALDLECSIYQPASLKLLEAREYLEGIAKIERPRVAVVAAYGQILPPWLLELPEKKFLNVHASLLPRWRGASPIEHAIWAGDKTAGVSIMQVVQKLDAGPVCCSREIPISPEEDAPGLEEKLAMEGARLLAGNLPLILEGKMPFTPQDESHVSYAPRLEKNQAALDWRRPAEELERQVRALRPWPGTQARIHGKTIKVLRVKAATAGGPAGQVLEAGENFRIACGEGSLELLEVQLEGRKALAANEFLRGFQITAGDRFEIPERPNPAPGVE